MSSNQQLSLKSESGKRDGLFHNNIQPLATTQKATHSTMVQKSIQWTTILGLCALLAINIYIIIHAFIYSSFHIDIPPASPASLIIAGFTNLA